MVTGARGSLALLCAVGGLSLGGRCGGGDGSGGGGVIVRIESPDPRCGAMTSLFPPGFDLVPGQPRAVAANLSPPSLVPFAVGDSSAEEVAEVLDELWGGEETLIVVSSDLSHYYDYETARRMDAETSRSIEALEPEGLGSESACGRVPVRGLLLAARRHGLQARTLDLRSSGDTAGSRDQVVGYGAYVFA